MCSIDIGLKVMILLINVGASVATGIGVALVSICFKLSQNWLTKNQSG